MTKPKRPRTWKAWASCAGERIFAISCPVPGGWALKVPFGDVDDMNIPVRIVEVIRPPRRRAKR